MVNQSIVVDNGSGSIKAGFAGDETPRLNCRTVVGRDSKSDEKHVNFLNFSTPEGYTGFKNSITAKEIKLEYPIHRGNVVNWEDMETIWNHTFSKELRIDPKEYNILMTEATASPKPTKEKTAQILFETFGFPAISIVQSSLLPLYAAGRTTGIVLDCGEGFSSTTPVWSGYPLPDASQRIDVGGHDLTAFLKKLLVEEGNSSPHPEISRLIKEKVCYISKDSGSSAEPTDFELPDGEKFSVGNCRITCPELLFNPSLLEDNDQPGIHTLVYKSILKTEVDIRKDLYANVIVSGGCTLIPGFVDRVKTEIEKLAPPSVKVSVVSKGDGIFATWLGGSILASLTNFSNLLVSKREYEEGGSSVLHKHRG